MKELELEAHKYAEKQKGNYNNDYWAFIEGAKSDASKEYWKKQLEKEKLEFAIEQLREFEAISWSVTEKIEELEKQLNQINV